MSTAKKETFAPLSNPELSAFCAQVAMLLKSGIPLHEGMSVMRDDADAESRRLLDVIVEQTEQGLPLYAALKESGAFPRYMLDMVEIGETSGRLEEVVDSLADYYDRQDALSQSLRRAVTYPAVMLGMMLVTILVLVVKVLPAFRRVYQRLGTDVSGFAQSMLDLGEGLGIAALVLLGILAVAAVVLLLMRLTPGGRTAVERLARRLPVARKINDSSLSGRFAASMAIMLGSGMELDRSLELAGQLMADTPMAARVESCRTMLDEGSSFADALTGSGIFSGLAARMVTVGLRTGSADAALERIARQCDQDAVTRTEGVISVLEPTLVAILSVVVGVILIAVMIPLMGIMSSIA